MSDYRELELISRRALHVRSLTELELAVAHYVIDFSYALDVPIARFKRMNFFCAACGIGKNKMSPVLARLEAYRIVRVDRREGRWAVEFCARPEQWLVPVRVRPGLQANSTLVCAWLRRINAPGMDEQPELWPEEPTLDDALFEVFREAAVARSGPVAINWADPAEIAERCRESLESGGPEAVPEKGTGAGTGLGGSSKGNWSEVVPKKGTGPIAIGRAFSSPVTGTGHRPAVAGFLEEQLGRLERVIGENRVRAYLPWWRKWAGQSGEHTNALRQTLDDFSDSRGSVREPDKWIVKTFKNKIRALGRVLHLI